MDEKHLTAHMAHTAIVTAVGEYDIDTLGPIGDELTTAAGTHQVVILDTSGLVFADSMFLNMLLRIHPTTTLRIAAPPRQLTRLLAMTGADTVLDIHPTVQDALAA
ncbi:STAS domain-containing protein [Streptomyces sp. NPDC087917]|uniref:STAS domain-containing protein n=1 Tax=Streptomyces sp. NPDC087917 TaxID=3155060 RepID=UPI00341B6C65